MTTESDVYAGLTEIFHDVFEDDSIVLSATTTAEDIEGWDSFNHINIVVAVEARYGIKIQTSEVETMNNVGEFVALILRKKA